MTAALRLPDFGVGRLPGFAVDLRAELDAGIAEHRAEIEAIAAGPWPPTFADTIEALERAGERQHLAEALVSRGALVDPVAALRSLTGREPSVGPLLERRGLTASAAPQP